MPRLRPCPPVGGWMCAASPASSTRPTRKRSASRVASPKRDSQRGECTPRSVPAVAADEVAPAQQRSIGQFGGHPVSVLAQPDQLAAAADLDAELLRMLGEQAVGYRLRDAEYVGMRGVQPVGPRRAEAREEPAD